MSKRRTLKLTRLGPSVSNSIKILIRKFRLLKTSTYVHKLRKFKQIYIPLFPYYYSFPFIQIFLSISLFPYSFILSLLSLTFFSPLILSLTLFLYPSLFISIRKLHNFCKRRISMRGIFFRLWRNDCFVTKWLLNFYLLLDNF